MSEFAKYERMHEQGITPEAVCRAGKDDGLDGIAILRMLRKVFNVSLEDAKRVSGTAEVLVRSQDVTPGKIVYWEGWTSLDGTYLMQARVDTVTNGTAQLTDHRKFLVTGEGLEEAALNEPSITKMRVSQLKTPLAARLSQLLTFIQDLSQIEREAV